MPSSPCLSGSTPGPCATWAAQEGRCSRRSQALGPLPLQRYELATWKKATVGPDYHVEHEGHYYSVPHKHAYAEVYVKAGEYLLEVFRKGELIASHRRSSAQGDKSTLAEHLTPAHRSLAAYTPEHLLGWAQTVGPSTTALVEATLGSGVHREQASRSCLGIMRLGSRYGSTRLERACRYCLDADILTYKGLRNVLASAVDLLPAEDTIPLRPISHANIRGQGYYA
ncbi:MAG: Mu transposase domain-containing protein [Anaerolineae bacterium]